MNLKARVHTSAMFVTSRADEYCLSNINTLQLLQVQHTRMLTQRYGLMFAGTKAIFCPALVGVECNAII